MAADVVAREYRRGKSGMPQREEGTGVFAERWLFAMGNAAVKGKGSHSMVAGDNKEAVGIECFHHFDKTEKRPICVPITA